MNRIKLDNVERYVRADKINFKTWDQRVDRHMIKVLTMQRKKRMEDEKWQIDSSKLSIRSLIGEGGYATVYFGIYDGEKVAVKLFKRGEDAVKKALFRQEISVWRELNHPNVTKFLGASMENSNVEILLEDTSRNDLSPLPSKACLLVLEYVPGGTLTKFLENRCKGRQRLSLRAVIRFALDLSRGLSYLHSKKIVHRDVKTDNMLLDYQNNLKITDFGVARLEASNPSDMTGKAGTPIYMAPEVIDGKPYIRKCDVYSFGICLWEIYCCSNMPFPHLSISDITSAVVKKNLRPKIPRSCPRQVATIMRRCWDADPGNRPEMDEVVRLLEAIDPSMVKPDKAFGCLSFL